MQKHQDLQAKQAQGILKAKLGLAWYDSNHRVYSQINLGIGQMPGQGKEGVAWQLSPSEGP